MKTLCFGLLAASMVYGQEGRLSKPAIGFVFDNASHTLRRVQGLPGAALVGAPVEFGFVPSNVFVAPRGDAALLAGENGAPRFFRLAGDVPAERAIENLASFQHVVYSPNGTAAALLAPGAIQVIKGLPDNPAVAGTISPRTGARQRRPLPDVLAVSDDGAYVIHASDGAVQLLGVAGEARQLLDSAPGTLAAFAPGNRDAAILQSDKLTIFNDLSGSATTRRLPSVAGHATLAFAPDGRSLLVGSPTARSVTTINVESGERTSLRCDCDPSLMVRMGNLFRLNEPGKGPLWLLDPANRTLFFVPSP